MRRNNREKKARTAIRMKKKVFKDFGITITPEQENDILDLVKQNPNSDIDILVDRYARDLILAKLNIYEREVITHG